MADRGSVTWFHPSKRYIKKDGQVAPAEMVIESRGRGDSIGVVSAPGDRSVYLRKVECTDPEGMGGMKRGENSLYLLRAGFTEHTGST